MVFHLSQSCTDLSFYPVKDIQIIPSGAPTLGQNGYTLTCRVLVAKYLCASIAYQWTKNNNTAVIQPPTAHKQTNALSFSPLRLSDAGQYTCYATISSPYLSSDVMLTDSHDVRIQGKSTSIKFTLMISTNY